MPPREATICVDLHCHSLFSDGTCTPEQLATQAREKQLALFCLSDHDTIAGYEPVCSELGDLPSLCSLELSCREQGKSVHLLLYGIEERFRDSLNCRLAEIREQRVLRVYKIAARLKKVGVVIDPDEILRDTEGKTPGRPHIASAIVAAGVCSTIQQAFARFLRDGGVGDVPVERLSFADGLAIGREHGAKMSLAHPHVYPAPALVVEYLQRFRKEGLEGIEAFYGGYSEHQRQAWLKIADEYDCVATAGSDFHGETKPDVAGLGVKIPSSRAHRLAEWIGTPLHVWG